MEKRAAGSRRAPRSGSGEPASRGVRSSRRGGRGSNSSRSESAPAPRRATLPQPALAARPRLRWNSPSRPEGTCFDAPRRSPVRGVRDPPGRPEPIGELPRGAPRRPSRSPSTTPRSSSPRNPLSSSPRRGAVLGPRLGWGRGLEAPGRGADEENVPSLGAGSVLLARVSPAATRPPALPGPPRGMFRRTGARYGEPSRATRSGRSAANGSRRRPGTASVSGAVPSRPSRRGGLAGLAEAGLKLRELPPERLVAAPRGARAASRVDGASLRSRRRIGPSAKPPRESSRGRPGSLRSLPLPTARGRTGR